MTKSEYAICEYLAVNLGQVFSKERIYEAVYGYDGESDASAITEHVKNIVQNANNMDWNRLRQCGGLDIDGRQSKRKNTDRDVFKIYGDLLC